MPTELLELLRSQTGPLHRQLDQHPLMLPLTRGHLTPLEYRSALEMMLIPHSVLETAVETTLSLYLPDYAYASRYPFIIKELGQKSDKARLDNVSKDNWSITNSAQLLGTLYVLEGSKLGAQVIDRQLKQQGIGSEFFASAAADAGMSWRRFRSRLALLPQEHYNEAAQSAAKGFLLYIDSAEEAYRGISADFSVLPPTGKVSPTGL